MQREVGARLADEYERARANITNAKVIRKKDKPSRIKYESVMPIAGLVEMEMDKWSATRDEQVRFRSIMRISTDKPVRGLSRKPPRSLITFGMPG